MPSLKSSFSLFKKNQTTIFNIIFIVLIILIFYLIFKILFKIPKHNCGCGLNCMGNNIDCPCFRRRMLDQNEYFTPTIGSDFTDYLNTVRTNQLQFQKNNKENYKNRYDLDKVRQNMKKNNQTNPFNYSYY